MKDPYVYVFYDEIRSSWDAIHAEMTLAERDVLACCDKSEQPYIITTLADDSFPHARLAASALRRFRRELPGAETRLVEMVISAYAKLKKQPTGGDREGQIVFPMTPDMMADAEAIAVYLEQHGYQVARLRYGEKVAYRVPIMLAVIYCGMVIG